MMAVVMAARLLGAYATHERDVGYVFRARSPGA